MSAPSTLHIPLPGPEDTSNLGARLASHLRPGDCVLLSGGLGAGKTHFARALIQKRLADNNLFEEVPSPTYTLVQMYDDSTCEIWHADLYRLSGPDELIELGLEEALETAITLIEWPDRLGDLQPATALHLTFEMDGDSRQLTAHWKDSRLSLLEPSNG